MAKRLHRRPLGFAQATGQNHISNIADQIDHPDFGVAQEQENIYKDMITDSARQVLQRLQALK